MKRKLRILASVTNKDGLEKFLTLNDDFEIEFVSTGGTLDRLVSLGFTVTPVENVTGFPEMLDGRLKTIHPKVAGGVLGDQDNAKHMEQLKEHGIETFDMVVVNLYDFNGKPDIENIDIGGPSLLRSAAKNWQSCVPVPAPPCYDKVIDDLIEHGDVSPQTAHGLACETFRITADYDRAIHDWFREQHGTIFAS